MWFEVFRPMVGEKGVSDRDNLKLLFVSECITVGHFDFLRECIVGNLVSLSVLDQLLQIKDGISPIQTEAALVVRRLSNELEQKCGNKIRKNIR